MDRLTKQARSANMAAIKSKNTKPELLIFKELKKRGLRFKKHYDISGKPDIAFPEKRVAIFVNGEFWHGKNFEILESKLSKFWENKIYGNIKRDKKNYKQLKQNGWKLVQIWDKDLNKNFEKEFNKIIKAITPS